MVMVFVCVILLGVFQLMLLKSQGQHLAKRLLESKLDELPELIMETRRNITWTRGPLNAQLKSVEQVSADERDRIALVFLRGAPENARILSDRLPNMSPETSLLFARQMKRDLNPDDLAAIVNRLAAVASDESHDANARLKAAIAIGVLDLEHPFWSRTGESICRLLVDANPTDLGWLADGLFPVGQKLISGLTDVRENEDAARVRTATFLLAEFAAGNPDSLLDLAEHAQTNQLSAIFPTLQSANSDIDPLLQERLKKAQQEWHKVTEEFNAQEDGQPSLDRLSAMNSLMVLLARRIGNLSSVMILRGRSDLVVSNLRIQEDPTVRSYAIHCYASGGGPAEPLVKSLNEVLLKKPKHFAELATALLQMLGNLPPSSGVPSIVRTHANDLYRRSNNPELNATAEWYLRKHGYDADLVDATLPETIGYQTTEGHTMIRLPGGIKADVGAPGLDRSRLANEQRRQIDVPDNLFVSRDELTEEQLNRFRKNVTGRPPKQNTQDDHRTAMKIGFFSAAKYCNWLSELEGIAKDQWVYLPNESGEMGPGMKIANDHLQRSGYQIPTPDLWEYACRSGTITPRYYGYGTELSSNYIRWAGTRSAHHERLAARLPNQFGLFDMLGNSAEWSIGLVDRQLNGPGRNRFRPEGFGGPRFPPERFGPADAANSNIADAPSDSQRQLLPRSRRGPRDNRPGLSFGGVPILIEAAGKRVSENNQFVVLGGAFDSPAHKIRSSDRSIISPPITNKPLTLRLMRVVVD